MLAVCRSMSLHVKRVTVARF